MKLPIILFFALCTFVGMQAQVTIGIDKEPSLGALLDLKSEADGTSKKGLGLPRVALSDINKLQPMYSYTDAANTPTSADEQNHIGLTVYNVFDGQCQNPRFGEGVYVWSGSEWQMLGSGLATDVSIYKDQNGNEFYAGSFGTAGTWMLQHLRATSYDPIRDGVDGTNNTLTGPYTPTGLYPDNLEAWTYPGLNPSVLDISDSFGLLYTWAAATRGKGGATGQDSTKSETGQSINPPIQGICPHGWHLPDHVEYDLLAKAIAAEAFKYSYSQTETNSTVARAMKNPCNAPDGTKTNGTSRSKERGGFSAYLAGYVGWVKSSGTLINDFTRINLWTSAAYTSTKAGMVRLAPGNAGLLLSGNSERLNFQTVRCKKN